MPHHAFGFHQATTCEEKYAKILERCYGLPCPASFLHQNTTQQGAGIQIQSEGPGKSKHNTPHRRKETHPRVIPTPATRGRPLDPTPWRIEWILQDPGLVLET